MSNSSYSHWFKEKIGADSNVFQTKDKWRKYSFRSYAFLLHIVKWKFDSILQLVKWNFALLLQVVKCPVILFHNEGMFAAYLSDNKEIM